MSSPSRDRAQLLEAFNHQTQLYTAAIVMFEQAAADQLALNIADLHCANVLRLHGPMTAGQLASHTSLTTGAVTAMIDRLVRVGFVRRTSDPHDRRRVIVEADGTAMEREIGVLYTSLAHATEAMIMRYSDEELTLLVDQLARSGSLTLDEAVKLRHPAASGDYGETKKSQRITVSRGTAAAGKLMTTLGATRLTITGDPTQPDLLRAQFGARVPTVLAEDGVVTLSYPHTRFNRSSNTAELTLNGGIKWQLNLVTSSAPCTADLRHVAISALDLTAKASNIEITLPQAVASVTVRIAGNANNVVLRCAVATALQVRLGRSESSLIVDGEDMSAAAQTFYRTPGYEEATDRYVIEVTARLTAVTIVTK
jgi:DNA-binding MarR family transcriptional regulator